jgi:hypothetical protein
MTPWKMLEKRQHKGVTQPENGQRTKVETIKDKKRVSGIIKHAHSNKRLFLCLNVEQ